MIIKKMDKEHLGVSIVLGLLSILLPFVVFIFILAMVLGV